MSSIRRLYNIKFPLYENIPAATGLISAHCIIFNLMFTKWQERTSFGHFIQSLHSEAKRTAIYAAMAHLWFFHSITVK